jgi:hypothetical protein
LLAISPEAGKSGREGSQPRYNGRHDPRKLNFGSSPQRRSEVDEITPLSYFYSG